MIGNSVRLLASCMVSLLCLLGLDWYMMMDELRFHQLIKGMIPGVRLTASTQHTHGIAFKGKPTRLPRFPTILHREWVLFYISADAVLQSNDPGQIILIDAFLNMPASALLPPCRNPFLYFLSIAQKGKALVAYIRIIVL